MVKQNIVRNGWDRTKTMRHYLQQEWCGWSGSLFVLIVCIGTFQYAFWLAAFITRFTQYSKPCFKDPCTASAGRFRISLTLHSSDTAPLEVVTISVRTSQVWHHQFIFASLPRATGGHRRRRCSHPLFWWSYVAPPKWVTELVAEQEWRRCLIAKKALNSSAPDWGTIRGTKRYSSRPACSRRIDFKLVLCRSLSELPLLFFPSSHAFAGHARTGTNICTSRRLI